MIRSLCANARILFKYNHKSLRTMKDLIQISDEITAAINDGVPVVALESTIITHGMPYPRNFEMARLVERTVRDQGAVPATIAAINGIYCDVLSKKHHLIYAMNYFECFRCV